MAPIDIKTVAPRASSDAVADIPRGSTRLPPRALLLAALSGVLQVLVFPSADLGFLCWICVVPLLLAVFPLGGEAGQSCRTSWQGFVLGYVTGLIWSFGACYWIYDV